MNVESFARLRTVARRDSPPRIAQPTETQLEQISRETLILIYSLGNERNLLAPRFARRPKNKSGRTIGA